MHDGKSDLIIFIIKKNVKNVHHGFPELKMMSPTNYFVYQPLQNLQNDIVKRETVNPHTKLEVKICILKRAHGIKQSVLLLLGVNGLAHGHLSVSKRGRNQYFFHFPHINLSFWPPAHFSNLSATTSPYFTFTTVNL